jgi:hypothetical protein
MLYVLCIHISTQSGNALWADCFNNYVLCTFWYDIICLVPPASLMCHMSYCNRTIMFREWVFVNVSEVQKFFGDPQFSVVMCFAIV